MILIKIKQQDLLHDGKNISDSTAYFTKVYMICLIFPSASQLALTGKPVRNYLQACAKLSAFECESKESRESNNHIKIPNWSSFKGAPYRNPDMSQQP